MFTPASESGQGMVEYALIIILVAIIIIVGLAVYGEFVRDLYVQIVGNI
jgi:Flp pilus assembly pilin Flp